MFMNLSIVFATKKQCFLLEVRTEFLNIIWQVNIYIPATALKLYTMIYEHEEILLHLFLTHNIRGLKL